ncbi:MAG: excinuclease ABC subunit UvrC [Pseudohongiellaceae bacterium]
MTGRPGVYQMLDSEGSVLYVGKARNLKRRVSNYFRASGLDTKTMAMVSRIADIEVTVTASETEALLLEQNLIKKLRPPYNIQLRDDKSYPYIMLTDRDQYPRLAFYRGSRRRDASFFGPYPSASAVRETLAILQKVFRLRQCEDSYFRNRSRPCLQYQIDRCTAPCVDFISPEEYAEDVHFTGLFLEGRSDTLIEELSVRMERKSAALDFEGAARIRDQITDLRRIQDQQSVAGTRGDADVLAAVMESGHACVHCVFIRSGRVIGSKNFFPTDRLATDASMLLPAFIAQYYIQEGNAGNVPAELLVSPPFDGRDALEPALARIAGRRVQIRTAVRSQRARWLEMARASAEQGLQGLVNDKRQVHQRFADLQEALSLNEAPQRIECFDISHTQGESTVASCVVFDVNGARKSDYRRYNIEDIAAGDDYAAMEQALRRRFRPPEQGEREARTIPDILLIDGGKGQLGMARDVLQACQQEEARLHDVLLIGIAKGISRKAGQETLFLATGEHFREIALRETSPALHLLQQVRDEAHRFAITGHRARRAKTRNRSPLEDIPGLGPKRRQALLRYFGGQVGLRKASETQITRVTGISKKLAADIYAALHNG